jgi:hypothetical protein
LSVSSSSYDMHHQVQGFAKLTLECILLLI